MTFEENTARAVAEYLLSEGALSQPFYRCHLWQTPIEKAFYEATLICSQLVTWLDLQLNEPDSEDQIQVKPQAVVLDWAVDYLFAVRDQDGKFSRLVVECDGHDFHERTKEQAARDRSRDRRLQEAGYTVFRFTGSEIYRNAFDCARQVVKWAEQEVFVRAGSSD